MIGNVGSLAIVVWLAVVGAATFDSVAAIAAGASGAADRATVTLRLKVPPRSVRGPSPAAERAILDAFLERHPWIRVEPYVELEMEGPRQEATFYMAMAGQTAPDVLRIYGRSAQKYIEQNFLYPLNGYLDEQDLADPMFQKVLPTIRRGGEVYGVPATVAVHALLYRKDLFERAGLDPEKPPRTWDELLEAAQRLTVPERGQYGMLLTGGSLAGWQFADFVWQAGGQIVRQQPDGTWRLALDEQPAVDALTFCRQLRWGWWERDGVVMQGAARVDSSGYGPRLFQEGRVAMMIVPTTQEVGRYAADTMRVGIAPLPAGPAGRAAMLEAEFWGINNLIANDPPRRDAAWAYIRFVTGEEAARIRTRVYVESGWASAVSPRDLERFGYEAELRQLPREWLNFYENILRDGRIEPYAPQYDQISTDLMSQLDLVLYSEASDPAEVLRAINQRANTAFFAGVPEEVQQTRRRIAWSVCSVIAAAGVGLMLIQVRARWLVRSAEAPVRLPVGRGAIWSRRQQIEMMAWLFLLPAVLSIVVWEYYPLVKGAALAFMDYRIFGDSRWIGLTNFIEAFTQRSFWAVMFQTCVYVALTLGLGFLAPIALAILLSEIPRGKYPFRTVFYLPAVTSGLVVMFIWMMMYDGSPDGVFNRALSWMTHDPFGRAATIGLVVLTWLVIVGLVVGALDGWCTLGEGGGYVLPWALLLMGSLLGVDAIIELIALAWAWVISGDGDAILRWQIVLPWIERMGWRQPVLIAGVALVWTCAVAAWAAGGFMWRVPGASASSRRTAWRLIAVAISVLGLAMAAWLNRTLTPPTRPYVWLQDPTGYWAMLWVTLPGIWAGAGPGCIVYLAALKSIPEEIYEAADLDGAGPFHKAWHVTIQFLRPLIVINFIGAFVGTFHAMGNILVMTGGGPGQKTMTIGMDIFFNAFTHLKFGYATAEAWMLGSLLIGFTVYQLRILKQLRFTRAAG